VERYFVTQKNNNNLVIGGVYLLSEFTSELIAATVSGARIVITGQSLQIARFDENEIEITGKIENVETILSRKRSH